MRKTLIAAAGLTVAAFTSSLLTTGSAAADPVVDPPATQVGHAAEPEVGWLTAVAPCSRYVDPANPAAGDTKSGSAAAPWATIGAAMRKLGPGETGCVAAGTYNESNLAPANSGTATRPIALKAQGAVTVIAPNDQSTFLFDTGTRTLEYWLVEGFSIDKQQRDGPGFQLLAARPGHVRAIAIRNNIIRNGKTSSALLIRGHTTDILVEGNDIAGFQRWESQDRRTIGYSGVGNTLGRWDANAISIEAAPPADSGLPSVERVRITRNSLHDNGGDGVQCQGGEGYAREQVPIFGPLPFDPLDIDIVDNRVINTPGSSAVEENAYDIKSCQRVSIRGSDAPTTTSAGAQFNKIGEFLPTIGQRDWKGTNTADGDAIVIHYHARSVLIENLRMWNVCTGVSIGRSDSRVRDIVVRRTLLFQARYGSTPPGGSSADAMRCRGRGISMTNTTKADIYHNTLTDVVGHGILMTQEPPGQPPTDVDIWNNIIALRQALPGEIPVNTTPPKGYWIYIGPGANYATIDSDYNVFWHPDNDPAGPHFLHGYYNSSGAPMYDGVDLATWSRRLGYDLPRPAPLGSVRANPLFVASPATNDYYTQPTSRARDSGLRTLGSPVCGAGPDAGFLESCS